MTTKKQETPRKRRYRLTYRCALDPSCPEFRMVLTGYSREDVEEQFAEGDDLDGPWKLLKVELIGGQS